MMTSAALSLALVFASATNALPSGYSNGLISRASTGTYPILAIQQQVPYYYGQQQPYSYYEKQPYGLYPQYQAAYGYQPYWGPGYGPGSDYGPLAYGSGAYGLGPGFGFGPSYGPGRAPFVGQGYRYTSRTTESYPGPVFGGLEGPQFGPSTIAREAVKPGEDGSLDPGSPAADADEISRARVGGGGQIGGDGESGGGAQIARGVILNGNGQLAGGAHAVGGGQIGLDGQAARGAHAIGAGADAQLTGESPIGADGQVNGSGQIGADGQIAADGQTRGGGNVGAGLP